MIDDRAAKLIRQIALGSPGFAAVLKREFTGKNNMTLSQVDDNGFWSDLKSTFTNALDIYTNIEADKRRAQIETQNAIRVAEVEALANAEQLKNIVMTAQTEAQREAAAREAAQAEQFAAQIKKSQTNLIAIGAIGLGLVALLALAG